MNQRLRGSEFDGTPSVNEHLHNSLPNAIGSPCIAVRYCFEAPMPNNPTYAAHPFSAMVDFILA